MLPREILPKSGRRGLRSYRPSASARRNERRRSELIERLADALLKTKSPILITSYAGRTPGASEAIERLAEFAGISVFESNMVNNISHEGPCFCGFNATPAIPQADVGLLVDVDVPWFPRDTRPNEATFWAHIDVDVLKGGSPMWSFPGQLRLQGSSAHHRTASPMSCRPRLICLPAGGGHARCRIRV
jgi:thiamine pyrophosphate-dependent acetolactate synthase large subunit-like protein